METNSNKIYEVSRLTLSPTPDITSTANSDINQQIVSKEEELARLKSELPTRDKLIRFFNENKETFKRILIPAVISLLIAYGSSVVQAVLKDIPLDQIIELVKGKCPSQAKLRELISKRNKLVVQLNNNYETITTMAKYTGILSLVLQGLKIGVQAVKAIPAPAPAGVAAYLIESEKQINNISKSVNIITITAASFGIFFGIIIKLLNMLDILLQVCSEDTGIPYEQINNEINILSNPTIENQNDNTYKGFNLVVKIDETNSSQYIRRYASAENKQGVSILKTDSSFASDPTVLINQLKFIIDSNPSITAE
jgi:hypothetical protein